jgi:hypothetical protein
MIRKLILVVALIIPVGTVYADAATGASGPPSSLQQGSSADTLQSGNLLQPASSSGPSLQSADAANGGAGQSATAQTTQQLDSSGNANLSVQGNGDQPHSVGSNWNLNWMLYALLISGIATALTAVAWLVQSKAHPAD